MKTILLVLTLALAGCASPCPGIHKMRQWSNFAVEHAESVRYRDYMRGRQDMAEDILNIYCR